MSNPRIVGAAMTQFGKFPDSSIRTLAVEAVEAVMRDANISTSDVDMVFFANAAAGVLTGQEMIRGQAALHHTGLLGKPIINVENACSSASTAFRLACMAVSSGDADIALAVGAEKLTHEDKRQTFAAIGKAVDLFEIEDIKRRMGYEDNESSADRSFFMDLYAERARAYMERTGATPRDFAQIAVKSHQHASLNPYAQYRTPTTVEEVLASREIAWPLTLMMCAPIADGAAATIVCSEERARSLGVPGIRVAACELASGPDRQDGDPSIASKMARKAFERASLGPDDVDVIELHDAAAPAEVMLYEELGLCPPGDGPKILRSGATALGGRIPVNPSGGLLSKGHPIGASGCAQIAELVDQLRGRAGARQVEGARIALAENGGGNLGTDSAAVVVTILVAD